MTSFQTITKTEACLGVGPSPNDGFPSLPQQTYRFFVGQGTDFDPATIRMVQADIGPNPVVFTSLGLLPAGRARWFDKNKGIVEVVLKLTDLIDKSKDPPEDLATKIKAGKKNKCQPATFCTWNPTAKTCNNDCTFDSTKECKDSGSSTAVCRWANADLDCPDGGCFGIAFTLPDKFATDPAPDPRPAAVCLPRKINGLSTPFDVSLDARKVDDGVCPSEGDKLLDDFCK